MSNPFAQPASRTYNVRAFPTDPDNPGTCDYYIDCSECGSLGVCLNAVVHETCLNHLESHGVDTTPWRNEVPD